jgi:hypothetical protein
MLTSAPETLVKVIQYRKIMLELVESMLIKYNKYCFQCKNYHVYILN